MLLGAMEISQGTAHLKENNRQCCEGFLRAGERVTLIDESFEKEMETLLDV